MLTRHKYDSAIWIDIVDPTDDELTAIADEFHLPDRAFDEAHRRAARPTMRRFADHAYLVAFSGSLAEIDMFLGPTWFISIRLTDPAESGPAESGRDTGPKPDPGPGQARQDDAAPNRNRVWDPTPCVERFNQLEKSEQTSGAMLAVVLDDLIDGYFDTIEAYEDKVESIEDHIFDDGSHTEKHIQHDLFALRRDLLQLRRAVIPLREVLSAILRKEVAWIDGDALIQCRDAFDKLLRVVDLVDEQRELLGNAVDAHLALIGNQMNLVMKKLTAWGSIVFGATLIAGIYGMNFTHMPELGWYYGYPMALGSMVVLSIMLYRMFRSRDWL